MSTLHPRSQDGKQNPRQHTSPHRLQLRVLETTGEQMFSVTGQTVNSLDFPSHNISVATTQLCQCGTKVATGDIKK